MMVVVVEVVLRDGVIGVRLVLVMTMMVSVLL